MSPFLILPFLAACSRAPDAQAPSTEPRTFTLLFEGNVAGELEPCG